MNAENEIENVAGHSLGTWGTGNQGGHKIAFQTPGDKIRQLKVYNKYSNKRRLNTLIDPDQADTISVTSTILSQ